MSLCVPLWTAELENLIEDGTFKDLILHYPDLEEDTKMGLLEKSHIKAVLEEGSFFYSSYTNDVMHLWACFHLSKAFHY